MNITFMHGGDVIEVLKALRQTRSLIQLPVIMVTSSQRTDRIADALRAGTNDYLTNRLDITLALTRIHTQLLFTKANEELHYREVLLNCQIEASPDGILMVSSERAWLSYNLRFLELWGLTGEVSDEPTVQKGFDILADVFDHMMELGVQFVLLGVGDPRYHELFTRFGQRFPKRTAIFLTFDTALAQRIYAGSDIFLMPSRFEPCGLGQMIALRYGAVPVVRATGGLEIGRAHV